MPIIDQLIERASDGLNSLEPRDGIDLKLLKRKYNDKVCLNCVYAGLDLSSYDMMNKIWHEEGVYK